MAGIVVMGIAVGSKEGKNFMIANAIVFFLGIVCSAIGMAQGVPIGSSLISIAFGLAIFSCAYFGFKQNNKCFVLTATIFNGFGVAGNGAAAAMMGLVSSVASGIGNACDAHNNAYGTSCDSSGVNDAANTFMVWAIAMFALAAVNLIACICGCMAYGKMNTTIVVVQQAAAAPVQAVVVQS